MTAADLLGIYADALLELATGPERRRVLLADCAVVGTALRAAPELTQIILDPRTGVDAAKYLLREIFASRVDPLLCDWLCLLVDRDRFGLIDDLLPVVRARADLASGGREVSVTTAVPCDAGIRATIEATLLRRLGPANRCAFRVDPAIIGGAVLRYGDRRIDGSIRHHLEELRHLVTTAPAQAVWDDSGEDAR